MSGAKNGGSAFPPTDYGDGMAMRDYFAGQALAGELASQADMEGDSYNSPTERANLAAWCYGMADAMLAERNKPNPAT